MGNYATIPYIEGALIEDFIQMNIPHVSTRCTIDGSFNTVNSADKSRVARPLTCDHCREMDEAADLH